MNAQKIETSQPHTTPLLDVSPVLETGSLTPLSTHWIPLHELLAHWLDSETLALLPSPVAPLLTAIGHAFFALSHETRALRLYTVAWEHQQQQNAPTLVIQSRAGQAVRHLHDAAHHWSRAAYALDALVPHDLDPAALGRARQLSRIARTQQERLWALIDEVQAERDAWDVPPHPPQEQEQQPPPTQQEEVSA